MGRPGLEETVTERDGGVVAGAGRRAEVLWPWEPEREDGPAHEGPPRPASGCFAQP